MVTIEQVAWTRDALERIYDVAHLEHSLQAIPSSLRLSNAQELQAKLFIQIKQLKPSSAVPPSSLAWRVYNALELRYVRAMTQIEAASELNISLRQLRREQDRGIEAIAILTFSPVCVPEPNGSSMVARATPVDTQVLAAGENEFMRLDDLIRSVFDLIDPLLHAKDVHLIVSLPSPTPVFWNNRVVIRQLLIMSVSWMIKQAEHENINILGEVQDGFVKLQFMRDHDLASPPEQEYVILQHMAREVGIDMRLSAACIDKQNLILTIPISNRQQVLMVDDNLDTVELTRRYLADSPFDLVAIHRSEDTIPKAQTLQPKCIVLDVMMPGRDGWEILALLKSHPDTMHIPVVVCSVLRNPELAFALGATAVLQRPHTAQQLLNILHQLTSQSHQRPAQLSS